MKITILFILSVFISGAALANTKFTREDFMRDAMERYGSKKISEEAINDLRQGVSDINSKSPIDYGNDVFMTSSSITDGGLMTMRFIMKSNTRFQINPKLISEELVNLVCTTKSIYSGIDAGVTAKVLLTTVDGFDVESGPISKSTCAKFK